MALRKSKKEKTVNKVVTWRGKAPLNSKAFKKFGRIGTRTIRFETGDNRYVEYVCGTAKEEASDDCQMTNAMRPVLWFL
ncbi:hypothetical protein L596_017773 [Steinernema carpocapsae]|uniref:Uncharacterized protein n=1 Tax=Steinernema carpocapsae TaxID=34508 RepID=A0A4U5N325_STECR|nr:hypothetical protein L596_017766 [Steinernema carpocapsae]TKR76664.1 hypothetical protein L596_017773 [Steinernema carpocapsae]